MKKRWSDRIERMAASFELPLDVAVGALRVDILSGREVLIENHKGLLDFNDNMIYVNSGSHVVKVSGSGLRIIAMNQTQLRISGKVSSVELSQREEIQMLRWLIRYMRGYAAVEVLGSFPEQYLNMLSQLDIPFWNLQRAKNVLRFRMLSRDTKRAAQLADRADIPIHIDRQRGARASLRMFRGRELLITGLCLATLLLLMSNFVILRIDVVGNVNVSEEEILTALRSEGVTIGTLSKSVHSQWLKPRIILKVPELSWFYINISGSVATVNVRERTEVPEMIDEELIQDVLAEKTGIVKKIEVYRGTACVEVGDTVLMGDVLISAKVVSPFAGERYVRAAGRVYCDTWYTVTVKLPLTVQEKRYTGHEKTIYEAIFSGERINLSILSGISYAFYDKIREDRTIILPGGFPLPFVMEKTTYREYELREIMMDGANVERAARESLTGMFEDMLDGEIVSMRWSSAQSDDMLTLTLNAQCYEEIT